MSFAVRRQGRPARRTTSMLAVAAVLAGTIVAQAPAASAAVEVDFTDFPGTLTSAGNETGEEGTASATDNLTVTKYLSFSSSAWLQVNLTTAAVVNRYAITSANDIPARDPRNWTLQGSNNGTTFTTIDTRSGQTFGGRFLERSFTATNTTAYRYYRLSVSANNGDSFTQLSELQLFGPSDTPTPVVAPTGLTRNVVRGDQVVLTWNHDRSHRSYDIQRSSDGQNWTTLPGAVNLLTTFRDYTAPPSSNLQYRVRGRNGTQVSSWSTVQATTPAITTPQSVVEPTKNKLMTLRYDRPDVAIYVETTRSDADAQWSYPEIERVWQYVKQKYPNIGTDRLQVLMFAEVGGGTLNTRNDAPTGYQTSITIGWHPEAVEDIDGSRLDVPIHEIGHIVEGWSGNVAGSPEFGEIWGDSSWADFFMYDVYVGLGLTADANRIYTLRNSQTYLFPRPNTYWFRDWFKVLWLGYGHTDVLTRYFDLVRTQFPQFQQKHTRSMNFGEYVHFSSGAAGADLKLIAANAFGWTAEYQAQLEQARIDFPGVVYPHS